MLGADRESRPVGPGIGHIQPRQEKDLSPRLLHFSVKKGAYMNQAGEQSESLHWGSLVGAVFAVVAVFTFGAVATELRRSEANQQDIDAITEVAPSSPLVKTMKGCLNLGMLDRIMRRVTGSLPTPCTEKYSKVGVDALISATLFRPHLYRPEALDTYREVMATGAMNVDQRNILKRDLLDMVGSEHPRTLW